MRDKRTTAWTSYGGLGPDLDNPECQMKRVTRLRVADFSNQLREINKVSCKHRPKFGNSPCLQPAQPSSRLVAIQYARSLPKIKKRITRQASQPLSPISPNHFDILTNLLIEHSKLDRRVEDIHRRYNYVTTSI